MTLAEALVAVAEGKRVRSNAIPQGWVLKQVSDGWATTLRVINEATGDGFQFVPTPERQIADWQLVEGWASYAN